MRFWKESSGKSRFGITAAVVGVILALALVALLTTGCYGVLPTPAAPTTAAPTPEPTQPPEPEATATPEPEPTQPPEPETQPPTAVISVSVEGEEAAPIDGPALVPAGQPIYFQGTDSVSGGSPITSYEWDFGTGEGAQGEVVAHTFNAPGFHNVTLTLTDESGESSTAVQQVLVEYVH
jgi:chitodextrinase